MDVEQLKSLVDETASILPKSVAKSVIEESANYLLGDLMTQEKLYDLAWRLCGNLHQLKARNPVLPWRRQRFLEWVPAQVVDMKLVKVYSGIRYQYKFLLLAGSPAGLYTTADWSDRFVRAIASRIGFKRAPNRNSGKPVIRLFRNPAELVTLRLQVLLDPERSETSPAITRARENSTLNAYNAEQLDCRDRTNFKCRLGKPSSVACYRCQLGYDKCRAGVRKESLVAGTCNGCKRQSWFNLGVSKDLCQNCHNQQLRNSEKS